MCVHAGEGQKLQCVSEIRVDLDVKLRGALVVALIDGTVYGLGCANVLSDGRHGDHR